MSSAQLLDRLEGVKATGPGRWIAKCPAHEDRSPSLSVRDTDDGRTLVYCFAGCGATDVLDAVGLEWKALFPENGCRDFAPSRLKIPAADLLVLVDHELLVAILILADIVARRKVSEEQVQRLIQASARIGKARDIANPLKVTRHAA